MTRSDILVVAAPLFMMVLVFIPLLARTWTTLSCIAVALGIAVALLWLRSLDAEWGEDQIADLLLAGVATLSWAIGISGAAVRLFGRSKGLWIANRGLPEILTISVVLSLCIIWLITR